MKANVYNDNSEGSEEGYEYLEGQDDIFEDEDLDFSTDQLMKHPNIAELLDEDTLGKISTQAIDSYEIDLSSRDHRRKGMKQAMDMALMVEEEKNTPWRNSSNINVPIIGYSAVSFAARAYPAIVRDEKVANGRVMGDDDGQILMNAETGEPIIDPNTGEPQYLIPPGVKKARADRNAEYLNYQLMEEQENWEEDTDKLLHSLPIVGSMFRKVYYNTELGRPESTIVYPAHLVVNYGTKGLDRAPRITEQIELYPYEIVENIRAGLYLDFDFSYDSEEDEPLSEKQENTPKDYDAETSPHLMLEQHCRLDLDRDGYPEPYIVTLHNPTQKVVRIVANYRKDRIKKKKGIIQEIKPETYYIKYGFIPSFDGGYYDLGFGELLLHINTSINTILNQLVDAGTLSNTSQGFIGRGLRIRGGKTRARMGEFIPVDTRGASIRDNLYQMQHPEPSNVLFQLLGLMIDTAKEMSGLQDVLAGEQMSNQPGVATLALIEQGLTSFKSIYKRIYRSIRDELRVLYRLNFLYLDNDKYIDTLDDDQANSRGDFQEEGKDVLPACNPHLVSDMQRMGRVAFLDTFRDDPFTNQMELRRQIHELAGTQDYEKLIAEPAPPPQDPTPELLMQQLQNERLRIENERVKTEIQALKAESDIEDRQLQRIADLEEQEARTKKLTADAVKSLAQAEGEEVGTQLDVYKAQVATLQQQLENRRVISEDNQERVPGVERTPDI